MWLMRRMDVKWPWGKYNLKVVFSAGSDKVSMTAGLRSVLAESDARGCARESGYGDQLSQEPDRILTGTNIGGEPDGGNRVLKIASRVFILLVPGAGIEPALSLRKNGF
jgi:hypothetical protein